MLNYRTREFTTFLSELQRQVQEAETARQAMATRLEKTEGERDDVARASLDARSSLLRQIQETDTTRQAITARLEKTEGERDEVARALLDARSAEAEMSGKLALLQRSRLLKVGRFMRRMLGLPTAY